MAKKWKPIMLIYRIIDEKDFSHEKELYQSESELESYCKPLQGPLFSMSATLYVNLYMITRNYNSYYTLL